MGFWKPEKWLAARSVKNQNPDVTPPAGSQQRIKTIVPGSYFGGGGCRRLTRDKNRVWVVGRDRLGVRNHSSSLPPQQKLLCTRCLTSSRTDGRPLPSADFAMSGGPHEASGSSFGSPFICCPFSQRSSNFNPAHSASTCAVCPLQVGRFLPPPPIIPPGSWPEGGGGIIGAGS